MFCVAFGAAEGCRRREPTAAAPGVAASPGAKYRCPMHPTYTSDKPGQCPICGMNFVAAPDEGERQTRSGRANVTVSPETRSLLGVRTDVVRRVHLYRTIRALGRVSGAGRPRTQPWVLTDIYESDLTSLSLGMQATLMVSYLPSKAWRGRVTDIAPTIDDKARTLAVRIEAEDPAGELRSGMFADVLLKCDLGMGLMVPDTAVIFSGSRRFVFIERQEGQLEPRELRLGPDVGFGFQVLNGAAEGDRVVTSANFLIDSESSLRGAATLLSPAGKDGR
jgi:multidrug efflux pump subunit AcrA (membrane-fusion protein)